MKRKELLKAYAKLQARLKASMFELVMSEKDKKAVLAELKRRSKKLHNTTQNKTEEWTKSDLPRYFDLGVSTLITAAGVGLEKRLKKKGVKSGRSKPLKNKRRRNSRRANAAMRDVIKEGRKSTVDQFNQLLNLKGEMAKLTPQILSDPKVLKRTKVAIEAFGVSSKRANALARSGDFEKAARSILKDRNGIYMFKDKSGRRWSYRRWSQMTTRSYQDQSRRNGFIETAREVDEDLAQIIDHPDESDSCRPYENRIISLFGKTKGYDTYSELQANPDHIFSPTCRHQLRILAPDEKP